MRHRSEPARDALAAKWMGGFGPNHFSLGITTNINHHTSLALLSPADVHYHRAQTVFQQRQDVMHAAYQKTPQRFVKGLPLPLQLPSAVWIHPPMPTTRCD